MSDRLARGRVPQSRMNGQTSWTLRIDGAPRTKKTSNQLVVAGGRHRIMPSKAWRQWCKTADVQFEWVGGGPTDDMALNCRAQFYRDARRGDAVGYYQGLADLLEKRGIILNDSQIVSWDGSRLLVDRENPRVEVTLEEVA